MALEDYKITTSDYTSKDISSLADRPALTAAQLKARFDSLVKNVVAVKFNGLIDALVTAIAGLMSKVTGGTTGNFASLSADGSVADSGKKAADFEAAGAVSTHNASITAHGGIPTRHTASNNNADAWIKILSFSISDSPTVRIEGLSAAAHYIRCGHWEMIISREATGNIRSDLIYATNGITPSSFDVRLDGSTIKVYLLIRQYISYRILSETICGAAALTTYNTAETPSGTAVTVNFWDIAALGISGKEIAPTSIELAGGAGHGGYIDFHFDGSASDYTSRIIENASGSLYIPGSMTLGTALSVSSGGTGAGNAADARANLGIRTYSGTVTVPSGYNYVTVSLSGVTSSYHAVAMRTGSVGTSDPCIPTSTVCGSGTVTVYFNLNGVSGGTSVPIYIIATL